MKFWGIVRFELGYQVRRPWTWIAALALLVFAFFGTGGNFAADATRDDFYLNSPFVVAVITVIGGMIWLLLGAMTAGDAAARDVDSGLHPLIYTTPLGKTEYLGGRFLAALALNALILLTVPAGILLAAYAPGVEPGLVGPFRPQAFINAYALIALPNAFIGTAIQFAFAAASGRPRAAYLGSVMLFFTVYVVGVILGFMGRAELAKLIDAIGLINIVAENLVEWTPAEKRTRLFTLDGTLLANRLLWLGIASAALAVTWLRFRFAHRVAAAWWPRLFRRARLDRAQAPAAIDHSIPAGAKVAIPEVAQAFGMRIRARQTFALAWASFRTIATSKGGLVLLVLIPLFLFVILPDELQISDVQLLPTTAAIIRDLVGPLLTPGTPMVVVPLLIVLFSGELVWREREAGLGEIAGAAPVPEWVWFLGKFLGMCLVFVLFQALVMAAGLATQAVLGYKDVELGLYLTGFFALQLPEHIIVAVLIFVVHVLVNHKYAGHLAALLAFVLVLLAPMVFGIEHNLILYGSGPHWTYTEMRGFGPSLGPWGWFKLYWAAWAALLALAAMLLWVRGPEGRLALRLKVARQRLTAPLAWAAGTTAALIITLGGFIFYNTNVLNEYVSSRELTRRRVEYERRFRRYEGIPQPSLARASLRVEIHPERGQAEIRGTYTLVNRTAAPIDSLHLATGPGRQTSAIRLDRPWAAVLADDELRHHIYHLERPLQPGDTLRLDFEVRHAPRGFRNSGADASVVANGTFFTDAWLPAIGYQRLREITSASDRRKYGLGRRPVIIPSLYDEAARHDRTWSETSAFEATVGTAEGQTAVAPGELVRTWTQNGRRYFHYVSDKPIGREWYFFSAAYAVREAQWNPSLLPRFARGGGSGQAVPVTVFYHPAHARNVDRMVSAVQGTLDYHARHYSPYANRQVRMVEHPGTGVGAHAGPLGINFSERYAELAPRPRDVDLPFAVMAHELAHHWWGGQLDYAVVEGAPLLSEGLAWYGAMRTVEAALGRQQLERLRAFMRKPYPIPPIRRGKPLLQADDPYAAYRKGPFAMYALSQYVGVEPVNTALRRLVARHTAPGAPLATSLDLYRELVAVTPDSLRYLARDLFERNTYWELDTDRVTAVQNADSTWRVTLEVRARKLVADSAGVETEVPMDEWVDIVVFGEAERGAGELSAPLYARRHRVPSGAQTITVTVEGRPALAGIDPYHVLDWEEKEDDDNIEGVERDGGRGR